VWGSEFTTKVATLQGDSAGIAATPNVKFWVLVVVVVVVVLVLVVVTGGVLPGFWNSRA
jgi:t-SNARE complex subunit (syntaxin)